eukprot:GGOE01022315.1.p1 GENE.GGOE01022315.1~~GGOE01022315.1.p1  ORF type:complete len:123 (-),score=1.42 GGOE01022315.1:9-377(-)
MAPHDQQGRTVVGRAAGSRSKVAKECKGHRGGGEVKQLRHGRQEARGKTNLGRRGEHTVPSPQRAGEVVLREKAGPCLPQVPCRNEAEDLLIAGESLNFWTGAKLPQRVNLKADMAVSTQNR